MRNGRPAVLTGRDPVLLIGPAVSGETRRLLDDPEIRALLSAGGTVRVSEHDAGTPGFAAELRQADRLLLTGILPAGALSAADRLAFVSVTATGYRLYLDIASPWPRT